VLLVGWLLLSVVDLSYCRLLDSDETAGLIRNIVWWLQVNSHLLLGRLPLLVVDCWWPLGDLVVYRNWIGVAGILICLLGLAPHHQVRQRESPREVLLAHFDHLAVGVYDLVVAEGYLLEGLAPPELEDGLD
jgi:hypothetical protein